MKIDNSDITTDFYVTNNIDVTTISDSDNNEHWFILKFPNGDILKYDILLIHYQLQGYIDFRKNIKKDAISKLRRIKLDSINKKLKS
jgi:hypothetical protein